MIFFSNLETYCLQENSTTETLDNNEKLLHGEESMEDPEDDKGKDVMANS